METETGITTADPFYLLWGSDGSKPWRGGMENSSEKEGHCAVLDSTDESTTHCFLRSKVVVVLLDKTHCEGVCVCVCVAALMGLREVRKEERW